VTTYRPWAYAPREYVRKKEEERFRQSASAAVERKKVEPKKKGIMSRAKGFAGEVVDKALSALDVPAENTIRPVLGALAYLGAEQKVDPKTGRTYRESPSFTDVGQSLKEAFTQSPFESFREGKQAYKERLADPELGAGGRVLLGAVTDPLTYVGPGAIKAVTGGAKLGRGGRFAEALLENPRAASVGGILGAAGAAQVAEDVNAPGWAQAIAPLAGGVAGGMAGGRYGAIQSMRKVGDDLAAAQGRAGRAPLLGLQIDGQGGTNIKFDAPESEALLASIEELGINFGIADDGTIFVDNLDDAKSAVARARSEFDQEGSGMYTIRTKGDNSPWNGSWRRRFGEADDRGFDEIQAKRAHKSNKKSGEESRYIKSEEDPIAWQRLNALERMEELLETGTVDPKREAMRTPFTTPRKLLGANLMDDAVRQEKERELRLALDASGGHANRETNRLSRELGKARADAIAQRFFGPEWTGQGAWYEMQNAKMEFEYGSFNQPARKANWNPSALDNAALKRLTEIQNDLEKFGYDYGIAPNRLDPAGATKFMEEQRRNKIPPKTPEAVSPVAEVAPNPAMQGVPEPRPMGDAVYMAGESAPIQRPTDFAAIAAREAGSGVPPAQGELPRTVEPGYRGPDAALGEPPVQAGGAPPAPPSGGAPQPPGQPPVGGGPGQFGSTPGADVLDASPRDVVLKRGTANADSWKAKVEDSVKRSFNRLRQDSDYLRRKVDPFIEEKRRLEEKIGHFVEWRVQYERAVLKRAGIEIRKVDDPNVGATWKLFAGDQDMGFADDVIEGTTDAGRAAYNTLAPEQQRALGVIGETNKLLNETKMKYGAEVRLDDDIQGDYFGRRVISRTYATENGTTTLDRGMPVGPSRRVGAERTKSRVVESVEALHEKGFAIDDPWATRSGIMRGKLLDAEDAYLKANLSALEVREPGSTVGLATVPGHPAFAGTWFPPSVAKRIKEGLDSKPDPNIVQAINAVLTPARASFDMSATLQQGLRLWLSNPKAAGEYWWGVVRSLRDPDVYSNYLLKLDDRARALGMENGLTDLMTHELRYTGGFATQPEFTFPKAVLDKVSGLGTAGKVVGKGFEASNNHFDRLLNLYRIESSLNQVERLKASGLAGDDLIQAIKESNRGINRAFGWTANEPTMFERSLLFAPRYTRASVETLFMALNRNGGIESQMARKHLALMLGEGAAAVWLVNTMRGYETDFDPRSNNFLRFRDVGGLDITPFGTYNTLFRALAQTVGGDETGGFDKPYPEALKRFVEGKLNPAVSLAYWPTQGETYLGEPLDFSSPKGAARATGNLLQSNLPFGVQAGLNEGPVAAAFGSTGLSNTPVTPSEKRDFARDRIAKEMFGKPYGELSGAEKSRVNETDEVAGHQKDADRNTLTRENDRSAFVKASTEVAGKLEELGNSLNRGEISGNEYRDQYNLLQAELRGARKALKIDDRGDKVLSGWFDLYDEATLPDGRLDYDTLELLQAEYSAKNPGIEEKVLEVVGARDTPVLREYRAAKLVSNEYWKIPAYRGMTADESRKASAILAEAQDMVSFGRARDMARALATLYKRDPEGVRLARRAQRVGANPARKKYRAAHPEMARFYSDIRG